LEDFGYQDLFLEDEKVSNSFFDILASRLECKLLDNEGPLQAIFRCFAIENDQNDIDDFEITELGLKKIIEALDKQYRLITSIIQEAHNFELPSEKKLLNIKLDSKKFLKELFLQSAKKGGIIHKNRVGLAGILEKKEEDLSPKELTSLVRHIYIFNEKKLPKKLEKYKYSRKKEIYEVLKKHSRYEVYWDTKKNKPTEQALRQIHHYISHGGSEGNEISSSTDSTFFNYRKHVKMELWPLDDFIWLENHQPKQIRTNPPWQRTLIKNESWNKQLVKSLILGLPLPSFIIGIKDGVYEVIDGQQRLNAIFTYIERDRDGNWTKNFKSPRFDNHEELSNKYFWELPENIQRQIESTKFSVILFDESSGENELIEAFKLYNKSATTLNAAEVRNAQWHRHKDHAMLKTISGNTESSDDDPYSVGGRSFHRQLRRLMNMKGGKLTPGRSRFKVLTFLEGYLAYSRRVQTSESTANVIQRYYENSNGDDSTETSIEIKDCIDFLIKCNGSPLFRAEAIHPLLIRDKQTGKSKFSVLYGRVNMIIAKYILKMKEEFDGDEELIRRMGENIVDTEGFWPDKQQTKFIWRYQAQRVAELFKNYENWKKSERLSEDDIEFIKGMISFSKRTDE